MNLLRHRYRKLSYVLKAGNCRVDAVKPRRGNALQMCDVSVGIIWVIALEPQGYYHKEEINYPSLSNL